MHPTLALLGLTLALPSSTFVLQSPDGAHERLRARAERPAEVGWRTRWEPCIRGRASFTWWGATTPSACARRRT